jgi:hypothetical protein
MKYKKWTMDEKLTILSSSDEIGVVDACRKYGVNTAILLLNTSPLFEGRVLHSLHPSLLASFEYWCCGNYTPILTKSLNTSANPRLRARAERRFKKGLDWGKWGSYMTHGD